MIVKNLSQYWHLLGALLLMPLLCLGTGCTNTSPLPPEGTPAEGTASVTFRIVFPEVPASGRGAAPRSGLSLMSRQAGTVEAQTFSYADVTRIQVDVKETASGAMIYRNFDLQFSAGAWTGTIPILPSNVELTFEARALNAAGQVIFVGSTNQTLTADEQTVRIVLAPINDGITTTLPRIVRILVPSQFYFDRRDIINFDVEANAGERLTYAITAAPGGGSFFPTRGNITLLSSSGTFVGQYVPPRVSADTEFTHEVTVTNAAGHSVTVAFRTLVRQFDGGDATDTRVRVLFNPVIQRLDGRRVTGTDNIIWTATVSDDGPASELSYEWSFTPDGSYDPAPTLTGQTNPTTLQNYTTDLRGELRLAVTDAQGGRTTLRYTMVRDQFPDNPVQPGTPNFLSSIRGGGNHTCVILNNTDVRCWGYNAYGQLGYANTLSIGDDEHPWSAGNVQIVGHAKQLALGYEHTCALLTNGFIRCWGRNGYGQLGYGTTEHIGDGEPVTSEGYVSLGSQAVKIAAGHSHTCAVTTGGNVRCWGYNGHGELGYGHTNTIGDDELVWTSGNVNVGGAVVDIAAGYNHTCALLSDGKVRCWGHNTYGQLGYGHTEQVGDNEAPASVTEVQVGGPAIQISAGGYNTCALLATGRLVCWGYNEYGQLGYPDYYYWHYVGDNETPAQVGTIDVGDTVLQVAQGLVHTCALLSNGTVKCWGYGGHGRPGYGNGSTLIQPPAQTVDLGGASAYYLTAGDNHTCALLSTGKARCWGYGAYGQLGYANTFSYGDDELPSAAGDIQVLQPTP